MAFELKMLAAAIVVGLVQLSWAALAARRQQDLKWAAGPRDKPMPIEGVAARLDRAFRNYMETFAFFAAAILMLAVTNKLGSDMTIWGSALYVVSRALYVPIYAAGIPRLRTLVWFLAIVGLVMVLIPLFQ